MDPKCWERRSHASRCIFLTRSSTLSLVGMLLKKHSERTLSEWLWWVASRPQCREIFKSFQLQFATMTIWYYFILSLFVNAATSKVALQIDIPASAWHLELLQGHLHGPWTDAFSQSWITQDVDAVTFTKRPVDSIQVLHATATALRQKVTVGATYRGLGWQFSPQRVNTHLFIPVIVQKNRKHWDLFGILEQSAHGTTTINLRIWLEEKEFNVQVISTARVPILVASASGLRHPRGKRQVKRESCPGFNCRPCCSHGHVRKSKTSGGMAKTNTERSDGWSVVDKRRSN